MSPPRSSCPEAQTNLGGRDPVEIEAQTAEGWGTVSSQKIPCLLLDDEAMTLGIMAANELKFVLYIASVASSTNKPARFIGGFSVQL